jgi:orotidine-5'-phosphate decarboxylase
MTNIRIVPALDTPDLERAAALAQALGDHRLVYGYKVGFALGLAHGLPAVVAALRRFTTRPIIYDHQKAGTDIPDTGSLFAATLAHAGVNEAILFPQAGPATLAAWVDAAAAAGLKVIVGGLMTHAAYQVSEGGFLADEGILSMYRLAMDKGVRAFVVPLTKPEQVRRIMDVLRAGGRTELYSPGFGKQGGDPSLVGFLENLNLIVGRSLLAAPDPVGYVEELERKEWRA